MNFLKSREMGGNVVHSSVKTFYYGGLHTALTLMWIAYSGPSLFCFWNIGLNDYPLSFNQFIVSTIVGFFSWAN